MSHYQLKKNNPYRLEHVLYMRMVYLIKDYKRMKSVVNDLAGALPTPGISVSDGGRSDSTAHNAMKIERMSEEYRAVEAALEQIPPEYRKDILDHICVQKAYPLYADKSTFSRWKSRLIYFIAQKLMYV